MIRHASTPAHWFAVLSVLIASGAVSAADEPAPAPDTAAVEKARAALASQIEQSLADCEATQRLKWENSQRDSAASKLSFRPAKRTRMPEGSYPYAELREGHQAILAMAYLVDSLGNPRFVHVAREVASNLTEKRFDERAVNLVRHAGFEPALYGGQPVALWNSINVKFIIPQEGRMGNILSDDKLTEYVVKARGGDRQSQAVVAYLQGIAPQEVGIPSDEQRHYLSVAATMGERSALATVTRMLGERDCKPSTEVESFLYRSAMAGRSDIELLHATRMLQRGSVDGHPEVLAMLRGAANADDAFVRLWAAGILATAPIEAARDPQAALEAAKSLKVEGDPDAGEALAAALAANGRYAEAVAAENAAITAAFRLHWKDAQMRQRLAKYKADQPWVGYLCDCNVLVPSGGT